MAQYPHARVFYGSDGLIHFMPFTDAEHNGQYAEKHIAQGLIDFVELDLKCERRSGQVEKHNLPGEKPEALDRQDIFSVLELFPVPMEVFTPDGVSLFVNRAFVDFFHITIGEIVGKFNILQDPFLNHKLGLTDYLRRVFAGELLSFYDMRVPAEEITSRYKGGKSTPAENEIYQDITCFPIRKENGSVAYVIALFMMKRVYQTRQDAMKAKAYMDAHWLDDFELDKIAGAAGLSPDHLVRLFKRFTGITPYRYYEERKIEKIKEALRDLNCSVREAFAACGADYSGRFADVFKRRVGCAPTEYRNRLPASPSESTAGTAPLCKTESLLFRVAGILPVPMQIFKQNGDIIFINEAVLGAWNVKDSSRILGHYNLIRDPLVNEQFGLREQIRRTFEGEAVLISDIRIPLERFWEWYDSRSAAYDTEAIYTNILNFTVHVEDRKATYVVSIFLTSRLYQGRSDVTRAKEYLENHWRGNFDADELARTIGLSPSHLARLFKKQTGMTLYSYYQEVKIARLKAALWDQNLSVAEAFLSCGFAYPDNFTRFFKKKVGMTPLEYRKQEKESK